MKRGIHGQKSSQFESVKHILLTTLPTAAQACNLTQISSSESNPPCKTSEIG
jgi:hypothetical protein